LDIRYARVETSGTGLPSKAVSYMLPVGLQTNFGN